MNSSPNQKPKDLKVDILECENQIDESQDKEEEEEEEASSSSFGDSMCSLRDDDGEEAQSMLNQDSPLKKKKLTDEWKRFSKPLTWRCKWLELKVKEIESKAKVYEKEIQSFETKSIPFSTDQTQRLKLYKRGRRKLVEETTKTDLEAYFSNHNLFSYAEKRKPTIFRAQCLDKETKAMSKEENECLVYKMNFSDEFLAKLLCEINEAQGRARALKKRVDKAMIDSEAILCCPEDLSKECGLVVEEPMLILTQREATTVQICRQRVSADHTQELKMVQEPPQERFLNRNSPFPSSGGLSLDSMLEDLMMEDEPEMEEGEENLEKFKKLMDEFAGREEEEEEDQTRVTKRRKTSQ